LQFTVTTAPTSGTLSKSSFTREDIKNGLVTYTSVSAPESGTDSIGFKASDGANEASTTYSFTVVSTAGRFDNPVQLTLGKTYTGSSVGFEHKIGHSSGDVFYRFDPPSNVKAIQVKGCKCQGSGDSACKSGITTMNDVDTYVIALPKGNEQWPGSTTKANPSAHTYYPMETFTPTGSNYLYWDASCPSGFEQINDIPISSDYIYYIAASGFGGGEGGFSITAFDRTLYYSDQANSKSPVISTNTFSLTRGQSRTLTFTELDADDEDTWQKYLQFTVTTAPTSGTLSKSSFTREDIKNGLVTYTSTSMPASGTDSIGLKVSDGANEASTTYSLTIISTEGQFDDPIAYTPSDGKVQGNSKGKLNTVGSPSGDVFYKLTTTKSVVNVNLCKCNSKLGSCVEPKDSLNDPDLMVVPVSKSSPAAPSSSWTKVTSQDPANGFTPTGTNYLYWDAGCHDAGDSKYNVKIEAGYDYYIVGSGYGGGEGSFIMEVQ